MTDSVPLPQAVFVCLVAVAAAAPQDRDYYEKPQIKLISYRYISNDRGDYEYGYAQDNDQKVTHLR